MSTILRRIREVGVQNKINMTEYERGGGAVHTTVSPPTKQLLIQNNLEIYRKLKGTVYTSPLQKIYFIGHRLIKYEGYIN